MNLKPNKKNHMTMKTYKISHTDLEVSRLAYGCMRMGRTWYELPEEEKKGRQPLDIFLAA